MILVTGAAGFIGSHFVNLWFSENSEPIICIDKLTYAAQPGNLPEIDNKRVFFYQCDISDHKSVLDILNRHQPSAVIHLAAESHIDHSIANPDIFTATNIKGSRSFLDTVNQFWEQLPPDLKTAFRFVQISTDEVYLPLLDYPQFDDTLINNTFTNWYSASKASADDYLRSLHNSLGFPAIISCCCNNFGPGQYPEKLVPKLITRALAGETLPIYGKGEQIHDWLYVEDHCKALMKILKSGNPGEIYAVTAEKTISNLEMADHICELLDHIKPLPDKRSYKAQIEFIEDRPWSDKRYLLNAEKVTAECDWQPETDFNEGLKQTAYYYLEASSSSDDTALQAKHTPD